MGDEIKYPGKENVEYNEETGEVKFNNKYSKELASQIDAFIDSFIEQSKSIPGIEKIDFTNEDSVKGFDLTNQKSLAFYNGLYGQAMGDGKDFAASETAKYNEELAHIEEKTRELNEKKDDKNAAEIDAELYLLDSRKDSINAEIANLPKEKDHLEVEKKPFENCVKNLRDMLVLAAAYKAAKDPEEKKEHWDQFLEKMMWFNDLTNTVGYELHVQDSYVSMHTMFDRVVKHADAFNQLDTADMQLLSSMCSFMDNVQTDGIGFIRYRAAVGTQKKEGDLVLKSLKKPANETVQQRVKRAQNNNEQEMILKTYKAYLDKAGYEKTISFVKEYKEVVVSSVRDIMKDAQKKGIDIDELNDTIGDLSKEYSSKQIEYESFRSKDLNTITKELKNEYTILSKKQADISEKLDRLYEPIDKVLSGQYSLDELSKGEESEYTKTYRRVQAEKKENEKKIQELTGKLDIEALKNKYSERLDVVRSSLDMKTESDISLAHKYKFNDYQFAAMEVILPYFDTLTENKFKLVMNAVNKESKDPETLTAEELTMAATFKVVFKDNMELLFGQEKASMDLAMTPKERKNVMDAYNKAAKVFANPKSKQKDITNAYRALMQIPNTIRSKGEKIKQMSADLINKPDIREILDLEKEQTDLSSSFNDLKNREKAINGLKNRNQKLDESLLDLANKYLGSGNASAKQAPTPKGLIRMMGTLAKSCKKKHDDFRKKTKYDAWEEKLEELQDDIDLIEKEGAEAYFENKCDKLKQALDQTKNKLDSAQMLSRRMDETINYYKVLGLAAEKAEKLYPQADTLEESKISEILGRYQQSRNDGKEPKHDDSKEFKAMASALKDANLRFSTLQYGMEDKSLKPTMRQKYDAIAALKQKTHEYIDAKKAQFWVLSPSAMRRKRLDFANKLEAYCDKVLKVMAPYAPDAQPDAKPTYDLSGMRNELKNECKNIKQGVSPKNIFSYAIDLDSSLQKAYDRARYDKMEKSLAEKPLLRNTDDFYLTGKPKDLKLEKPEKSEIKQPVKDDSTVLGGRHV